VLITTNLGFAEWARVFADENCRSACKPGETNIENIKDNNSTIRNHTRNLSLTLIHSRAAWFQTAIEAIKFR